MAKRFFLISSFCICCIITKAQQTIVYSFEQAVTDTLQSGLNGFEKQYQKPIKDLNLFATISEKEGNIEIYIEEYSPIRLKGFINVIKRSNRKLKIGDNPLIPIVFPSDVHSIELQKDKIASLPFSGFYVRIIYEKLKVKSIQTAILF